MFHLTDAQKLGYVAAAIERTVRACDARFRYDASPLAEEELLDNITLLGTIAEGLREAGYTFPK